MRAREMLRRLNCFAPKREQCNETSPQIRVGRRRASAVWKNVKKWCRGCKVRHSESSSPNTYRYQHSAISLTPVRHEPDDGLNETNHDQSDDSLFTLAEVDDPSLNIVPNRSSNTNDTVIVDAHGGHSLHQQARVPEDDHQSNCSKSNQAPVPAVTHIHEATGSAVSISFSDRSSELSFRTCIGGAPSHLNSTSSVDCSSLSTYRAAHGYSSSGAPSARGSELQISTGHFSEPRHFWA